LATIRDVAHAADVSIATVSRVLNGSPRVSDDTRRRVLDAARKLEFAPNSAARSLSTNRTNVLGVLLPDLYGEFYSEIIRGIDAAARAARYQILISSSHANTEELVSAVLFMRGRIDGLLVMAPDDGAAAAMDRVRHRTPLVWINPRRPVDGSSAFAIANDEGARAATEHLLKLGHRSIAMLSGPPGNADAEGRLRGYREALRVAGVEADPRLEISGDFTESSGYGAAALLLEMDPRPTALFASDDTMAIGLLSALHSAGIDVPGELSLVGFDDIAIARYLSPPLTTVRVDAFRLGKEAVAQLVRELKSDTSLTPRQEVLPTRLVVRHSCAMANPSPSRSGPLTRPSGQPHEIAQTRANTQSSRHESKMERRRQPT
jgi:LacI family transcriptional regulator